MCYDNDARPPDVPGGAGSARGEDIVLTATDGTDFSAYMARAGAPKGAQVLIYPDIRGLHGFYKELALRFAEQGYDTLAIDYFGRTAGVGERPDDFDWQPHVAAMLVPQFFDDARAGLDYLRQGEGAGRPTFVVGFCRGGSLALLSGAAWPDLTGIIPFYSGLARQLPGSEHTVLEQTTQMRVPVLGLFGGADTGIPSDQVQQLDENLDQAGVEHEIVVYDGAPHGFFDRKQEEFAEASADAWRRVLGFIAGKSA